MNPADLRSGKEDVLGILITEERFDRCLIAQLECSAGLEHEVFVALTPWLANDGGFDEAPMPRHEYPRSLIQLHDTP